MRALVVGLGLGIYALAAVNGYAWEMLWLPAVVLGAARLYEPGGRLRSCLGRLLGRR
ncbi:MAG TPA: hypothetical protein VI142_04185 [Gaiellaceae bacterium]